MSESIYVPVSVVPYLYAVYYSPDGIAHAPAFQFLKIRLFSPCQRPDSSFQQRNLNGTTIVINITRTRLNPSASKKSVIYMASIAQSIFPIILMLSCLSGRVFPRSPIIFIDLSTLFQILRGITKWKILHQFPGKIRGQVIFQKYLATVCLGKFKDMLHPFCCGIVLFFCWPVSAPTMIHGGAASPAAPNVPKSSCIGSMLKNQLYVPGSNQAYC